MVFLDKIHCARCNKIMRITIFDKENKKIHYKCSCGRERVLSFEDAETTLENSYFSLNQNGDFSYECDACECYCEGTLGMNSDQNKKIIFPAYEGFCRCCHNRYEDGAKK